jgi:hypothetical protein
MGGMDWIDLAQERDRWWGSYDAVMNFEFHKMRGISWLAADLLASQGLCSVVLISWLVSYMPFQVFVSLCIRSYTYVPMLSSRDLSEKRGLCGLKIDC